MSETQVHRKLKALTGKSTGLFIRSIRIKKAETLLSTTSKSIKNIAYEVGFKNPSYFSRAFKEKHGISPNEFKAYTPPP